MSDRQRIARTNVNNGAVASLSTDRPFSGRSLKYSANASKPVHQIRPAIVFRPRRADHVSGTPSVPNLFTHSVVYVTAELCPPIDRRRDLVGGPTGATVRPNFRSTYPQPHQASISSRQKQMAYNRLASPSRLRHPGHPNVRRKNCISEIEVS